MLNKLPKRFHYTIHNIVAHPLSELFFQMGFKSLAIKVHDCTLPTDNKEKDNTND